MDSPGGLQAEKKVSFSYSFGFLLQTKEFQQNHTCSIHPNRYDSSTVVDKSTQRKSNRVLTYRKSRGVSNE